MNIENEIFKRCKIDFTKLEKYGFNHIEDKYVFSKNILNNKFKVEVVITSDKCIKGKIIDLDFLEEYTNYRINSAMGEFVSKVKNEFINLLLDIKENCTIATYFVSNQANRLANLINDKYQIEPEFLWKDANNAVFRVKENKKWFGIIMLVKANKITKGSGEVEVLNVKLDNKEIAMLLKQKGYFEAYHMNKSNWLSIILNDTIPDKEIMKHIIKSYDLVSSKK